MNIRMAVNDDAASLVEFNRAMALETEGKELEFKTVKQGVEAVFEDERKGFYLVAEQDSHVVGSLMVTYEWSDWRNGWFWWIQSVYIRPEARGKRIYSRLYEFLKQRASESNVCGFRLYAETENHHAQTVYKKVGMTAPHYVMFEEGMTQITEAEFARIVNGIYEDRESIVKHNPIGTPDEVLLWMLLSCLISYLNLTDLETPCFTGKVDASTYEDAIDFILRARKVPDFDASVHLQKLKT